MSAITPLDGKSASAMGDILVAAGRLNTEQLARILSHQASTRLPFGEAAMDLGILQQTDIDYALSQQFDYAYLNEFNPSVSTTLVAAYKPFSRIGEQLRAIRSQLIMRWLHTDVTHKAITLISATPNEGRSFISANLAIVFAQQGQRTLLIDGDMRPNAQGIHTLFKLPRNAGLSDLLAERANLGAAQSIPGLAQLAVLSAGTPPPNPQELLGRPQFAQLLRDASDRFDVILIDTPSASTYADCEIIAARTGAAVLVTRKNQSKLSAVTKLCARLRESGVTLIGSILNDD